MYEYSAEHSLAAVWTMVSSTGCNSSRRPADHVEDFTGRGLVFERLAELAGARLHLVEQPHILDRDHRLVGEGRDQLDLLVGEWFCASCASG